MENEKKPVLACLSQIYGESTTKKYRLKGPQVTIGRSYNAEIRLNNPNVSRKHCTLMYSDDGWKIIDCKSQNGTFISGKKLKPGEPHLLQCGDIIFLGPPAEMPEAFCYDDVFENYAEFEKNVPETPSLKRPAQYENITVRKKNRVIEDCGKIMNTECVPNNVLVNSVQNNEIPSSSKSPELPHPLNYIKNSFERSEKTAQDDACTSSSVNSKQATSSRFVSSEVNDNGDQIPEISSTGDDQNEDDSQSLLYVEDNGVTDFSYPNSTEAGSSCCNSQETSNNSKKIEILQSQLAALSKEIKYLQKSKTKLITNYEDVCKKNKSLNKQLAEEKKLKADLRTCELKAKDEVKGQLLEKFEEDLICNICTELLIKPAVLDCSHTFCQFCIKEWKKKKNECPICRHKIQSMTPVLTLEHFIDRTLLTFTPEQRDRRNQLIKERENVPKKVSTPTSRRSRHGRRRSRRHVINISPHVSSPADVEIVSERRNLRLPLRMDPLPIPFSQGILLSGNISIYGDNDQNRIDFYVS